MNAWNKPRPSNDPRLILSTHPDCVRTYGEFKAAADIAATSGKKSVALMVPPKVGGMYMVATSRTQDLLVRAPIVEPASIGKAPCGSADPRCLGCAFFDEQSTTEHLAIQ